MLLPLLGDLSASPEPNTIDLIVALNSIHSVHGEAVFSEVVNVSQVAILQVIGQVTNNTFALVFDVVHLPQGPSGVVELAPQLLQGSLLVLSIAELTLPVVDVEGRLRE